MIEVMNYNGKEIYYLDASELTTNNIQEIREDMEKVKKLVSSKPPKSALMITNVTNVRFNSEMVDMFKEYANHNTPYVKASALVGVSGIQKVVLSAVKTLTGRDFYLANSLEEAKEWVANH